jgi:hydroxyacylglutathione hydrolase
MLEVVLLPALQDNCIAFLISREEKIFWSVDPGDPLVVKNFISTHPELVGAGVFCTHHHADHTDAVSVLVKLFRCPVWGPAHPKLASLVSHPLRENEVLRLGSGAARMRSLETPGHTVPALSFVLEGQDPTYLFAGDTLFGSGCGRLFEGSPAEMWHSLQKLRALPPETLLVCGHEYTERNLRFVESLQWRASAVSRELERVTGLRSRGESTLPRSLRLESQCNPFLQADDPELVRALGLAAGTDPSEVFRIIREKRNFF